MGDEKRVYRRIGKSYCIELGDSQYSRVEGYIVIGIPP
jgi:hypothetical protein